MAEEFTTRSIKAKQLMVDDRFKMGGEMYRVFDTYRKGRTEVIIRFYSLKHEEIVNTLFVDVETDFKIYNLVQPPTPAPRLGRRWSTPSR